ncbi:MAG: DUF4143 domain-containing protein [Solirubrobacterales bacterium]
MEDPVGPGVGDGPAQRLGIEQVAANEPDALERLVGIAAPDPTTSWPSASSISLRIEPSWPATPVTRARTATMLVGASRAFFKRSRSLSQRPPSAGSVVCGLEGAKGVGKTATTQRRAATVVELDDPAQQEIARADVRQLLRGRAPILFDEWQRVPAVWDAVRRAVDKGDPPGPFLMTGSAVPEEDPDDPEGSATHLDGRARRLRLDGYVKRLIARDFVGELGVRVRQPDALRAWMRAYAAATATVTSLEKIRDAASVNHVTPARKTTVTYDSALRRLFILDPVDGWLPTNNHLRQVAQARKHHLVDPALAAHLLGMTKDRLLSGEHGQAPQPRDGTFLGALFESLVTLSVRVLAQASEARVRHLRTHRGRREVDLVVEDASGGVLALEVKLSAVVDDDDVKHLVWLRDEIGDDLRDAAVITTGPYAYRRDDGIAVVPLALLGP